MNREEVIKYCLKLKNTFEDYPFKDDNESVTLKHKENKKWFALIMSVKGQVLLNIKTDPDYSDLLRRTYDYIIPAYHMNKEHWNTIVLSKRCNEDLVKELLKQSYDLTNKKVRGSNGRKNKKIKRNNRRK